MYSNLKQKLKTKECFLTFNDIIKRLISEKQNRSELARNLLIEFGDFETALTDVLCSKEETYDCLIIKLRETAELIGTLFFHLYENDIYLPDIAEQVNNSLDDLFNKDYPDEMLTGVPEGYAFYAYYPEMYIEAARKFYNNHNPQEVISIGLRSIGTSLSSAVASFLKSKNCKVDSITFRPRGNFDNRFVKLSEEMKTFLREMTNKFFLIIDEGPGISGSSFCAASEALTDLGIENERIIFLSSWEPDGSGLISEQSRRRWYLHKKYSASFDEVWIHTEKLLHSVPVKNLINISNGEWRKIFYINSDEYPPVYPNNEKKKYLCGNITSDLVKINYEDEYEEIYLLKFGGLGKYGERVFNKWHRLAEESFTTPVIKFSNGFILSKFIPGTPANILGSDKELINTVAQYCSFVNDQFPVECTQNFESLYSMILENIMEFMSESSAEKIKLCKDEFADLFSYDAVEVDGHMMPHEWIKTKTGYIKIDGAEHHADHFFPGCQNIAWDLAGCSVEFMLDFKNEKYLLDQFNLISPNQISEQSFRFYKIAYLSYRLGYAYLASDLLVEYPEGKKFKSLFDYYYTSIKNEIDCFMRIYD